MWLFVSLVLCFSFFLDARAQDTGSIVGRVQDSTSGSAIEAAVVRLGSTSVYAVTDKNGAFRMESIPLATYTLHIEATGFAAYHLKEVTLSNDATTDLFIELTPGGPSEMVESTYQTPLYTRDVPGIRNSISSEELRGLPRLSPEEVIKTRAGVVSFDGQPGLFIRGNEASTVDYYLDGFKLAGDVYRYIPRIAIEQLSVNTGHLPADEGDVMGGIVHISTKSNTQRPFTAFEGVTSEALDPYGYNTISGALGLPLAGGRVHFFAAGEYSDQLDSAPSALGQLQVKPEVLENLRAFPMSFRGTNDAGEQVLLPIPAGLADGTTLDVDDDGMPLVSDGHLTFSDGHTIDTQGIDPANIILSPSLRAEYLPADAFSVQQATIGRRKENLSLLGNLSVDILPNTRLSAGGLFNRRAQDYRDAGHELRVLFAPEMTRRLERDDLQLHAALRHRFSATTLLHVQGSYSNSAYEIFDPRFGRRWDDLLSYGNIDDPVFDVLRSYKDLRFQEETRIDDRGNSDPTDDRTFSVLIPVYESTYFDGAGPPRTDEVVGGLVQIPGGRFNTFEQFKEDWIRLSGYFTAGFGIHQVTVGGTYEKRTQRYWQINAPALARFFADEDPEQIDPGNPALNPNGYDAYEAIPLNLLETTIGTYYGYDLRGQNEVNNEDFDAFILPDPDKPLTNYNLAPYQPEQFSGYLQDKIRWGNLILDAGVRLERFNNNTLTLRDPFSRRPVCRVQDIGTTVNGVDCGSGTVPASIGNYYAVFYSGQGIVGYRDTEGNFYDADGQPATVGEVVLNGQVRQTSNVITREMFTPYQPQLSILPRLRASFTLAGSTTFFASYGVFSQPPSKLAFATLFDFERTGSLPNTNLKPERLTKLEVGFHRQWSSWLATTVTGFMYRGKDLIAASNFRGATPNTYEGAINRDRSLTRGVEVGLAVGKGPFTANANYTLSQAEGPLGRVYSGTIVWIDDIPPALNDIPQIFDQRHRFNTLVQFNTDEKWGPQVHGIFPFEHIHASILIQMGSGFPYTAVEEPFNITESRAEVPRGPFNGFRMSGSYRVDLQLGRQIYFANNTSVEVFLLVQNLFDHTNVNRVWPFTGQVDTDGFLATPAGSRLLSNSVPNTETLYQHRNRIPSWAGIPRLVRVGMRLAF